MANPVSRKPQQRPTQRGVNMPVGMTASSLMLDILEGARTRFPDVYGSVELPASSAALKRGFSSLLLEFEQRRCSTSARVDIARRLVREVSRRCFLRPMEGEERPLSELSLEAKPLPLERADPKPAPGWVPSFRYAGRDYSGRSIADCLDELGKRRCLNDTTREVLHRALDRLDRHGALRLPGMRFAMLGAGAELAPTRALLEAGATVLWTDVKTPPPRLREAGGELVLARGGADLLAVPQRIGANVLEFASDGGAHLGLFAYGPGGGREWRIGTTMNALVRALPRECLKSVGMLISPTTPTELEDDDLEAARACLAEVQGWRKLLLRSHVLRPSRARQDLPAVSDTIVGIQGMSYQAAQWIEKTLVAEALRQDGFVVSANVAPITRTESMSHPLFKVGFRAAHTFGVEIFDVDVTRTLTTLLYIEDVLGEPPSRPRHLHGGAFSIPYSGESALRVATAIGFARPKEISA